jgi:ferric-dicitrate binding protein FerR (iron transport regulator)
VVVGLPAVAAIVMAIAVSVRTRPDEGLPAPASPVAPAAVVATLESAAGSGLRVFDRDTAQWTPLAPGSAVRAGALLETGTDAGGALRLTSGVSLRTAAGVRMRLGSEGEVSLERGVIYIDNPGHEPRASVVVRTPFGSVREIGTQFEVRLDDATLRVRVREGTVALERDHRTDTATTGIELRVEDGGALARRQIPISGREWAWAVGMAPPMAIEGARLDAFLAWAARELGWRVAFANEALERESSGTILHGSIEGLTPDQAVETVLATCGLTYRVQEETLTIGDADRKMR